MLVNWKGCRTFMLDYAKRERYHEFTQVKKETILAQLEAGLREQMRRIVKSQPSKGKTIK